MHQLFKRFASGTFHVVGDQRVSKYEFATQLASIFDLNGDLISVGSMKSQPNFVVRPHDMSLSNDKVSKELDIIVGGIKEHISLMKQSHFSEFEAL